MKYTIITGNPIDGYECYGIFDTAIDATEFANGDGNLDETWHVMTIHPTEKEQQP